MSQMPPRSPGAEFIPLDPDSNDLVIGKVTITGAGVRVGLVCAGKFVHMSPAGARRLASDFETPDAIGHDLGWVAPALREAADEIEALTATKQ